jgi:hypothetical protein
VVVKTMAFAQFKSSLSGAEPPRDISFALAALWWAAKNDWERAHKIVMDETGKDCAWVHAYLHRVEGDIENARYWYGQAGRPVSSGTLEAEWETIAAELVAGAAAD